MSVKTMAHHIVGRKTKNFRGQTLIEALVTLAVAVVIVTALVVLVIASNRRTTLSRQINQATKLAQEGIEIVRVLRENDERTIKAGLTLSGGVSKFCSDDTGSATDFCRWSDLYLVQQTPGADDSTPDDSLLFTCLGREGSNWVLREAGTESTPNGDCEAKLLNGLFERRMIIEDWEDPVCTEGLDYTTTKKLTVRIRWKSPTGQQERRATTCLTTRS